MNKHASRVLKSFQIKYMTKLAQNKFDSVIIKNDIFVKWLVGYMVQEGVPFRIIPMGAGVTKVVHEGSCCPNCNGKGFFPIDEKAVKTDAA